MAEALDERRLFGTNGVRGVVNKELTLELVIELSQAIGTFFKGGRMVVGSDGRTSSPSFKHLTMAGLASVGCKVYDIGQAPTPMIDFLTRAWKADGGIAVTASHNPPEYNGIKTIKPDGVETDRDEELEIEKIYFSRSWERAEWNHVGDIIEETGAGLREYLDSIKTQIDVEKIRSKNLKVAVDPGNGVSALTAPILMSELGCKVLTINANVDGRFPGRLSEPKPDTIGSLMSLVKSSSADFGVALDGDGDRAIFVDEMGEAHWGDRSFALIADNYFSANPGRTIVTPVSSSKAIKEVADSRNGKIVWTRVGSVDVSHKMIELGADLGGEENGGIFYAPHIPVRDGSMAAALIADIVAKAGQPLSKLLSALPSYQLCKEKVPCPNDLKKYVLEGLRERTSKNNPETIDGVKVMFNDGRSVLVRPSGTEPIFRVMAEGKTTSAARNLADQYKAMIAEIIKEKNRDA
ncbi:MAG TPA: phosphoglucosamine mutase [Candidatus Acidoferrum sp.]|nr:phosphoglucosamine mutase [Candidatus Acidoferrum sp.]